MVIEQFATDGRRRKTKEREQCIHKKIGNQRKKK
jgi:hypothetical protein